MSVWDARQTEAHRFLIFVGCIGSLPTNVGVLLHDPSGGSWGVIIGRLDPLCYTLPKKIFLQVSYFILSSETIPKRSDVNYFNKACFRTSLTFFDVVDLKFLDELYTLFLVLKQYLNP